MTRFRLDISYDGGAYHGWAIQHDFPTIQGTIENTLEKITRSKVEIFCAGRTDALVHATGQVAHLDFDSKQIEKIVGKFSDSKGSYGVESVLLYKLNSLLPNDIVINKVSAANSDFDARRSAKFRVYKYYISNDIEHRLAHLSRYCLEVDTHLDVEKMNEAAKKLIGRNDFLSFIKPRDGQTTIRDLLEFRFDKNEANGYITATICANAFAHNMVRCLIGASLLVGKGQRAPEWLYQSLVDKKRKASLGPAQAKGLFLEKVEY
ncbi:MAG: tRNA pseudouridine(38-40) synthase TruA [Bifidobacteriaceae bacterium]|nr:tRNA pseudouridine(38-40) synthase TruA [Bifidobacteriaceae bacterium]